MVAITIASPYRNLLLSYITNYIIISQSSTASYDIPGKEEPTVDTDTTVTKPTIYKITADISDTEKAILILMRGERQHDFTMVDNIDSSPVLRNVRVDSIEISANITGKTTTDYDKWSVDISLSGIDH